MEFSWNHPVSFAQGQSSDAGHAFTSVEPGRTDQRGRLDGFTEQTLACLVPELPPLWGSRNRVSEPSAAPHHRAPDRGGWLFIDIRASCVNTVDPARPQHLGLSDSIDPNMLCSLTASL